MASNIPIRVSIVFAIGVCGRPASAQQLYDAQPSSPYGEQPTGYNAQPPSPYGAQPAAFGGSPYGSSPSARPYGTGAEYRDVEVTVYGKGGVRTDLTNIDQASQFNGGLGASVLVRNRYFFSLAIDGTALTLLLQSTDTRRFAAAVVNTQLGPYSLALDSRFENLLGPVGLYVYGRASSSRWQFADGPKEAAIEPQYNVVTYGTGIGATVGIRVRPKTQRGNYFTADAGLGLALRGLGGDITLEDRHTRFLNSSGVVFLAPELKTSLQFNALQLSGSFFYFPAGRIEGLTGARLLIAVSAVGDLVHL